MSGAKQKFESMVKALSGDLHRYAFSRCRNPTLSDDLVQETFMPAWCNLSSLRDDRKAKSWLITTLRREHARLYAGRRVTMWASIPPSQASMT